MAAFPTIDYSRDRLITPDTSGRVIDVAQGGRGRGRIFFSKWFFGTIPHLQISSDDRDDIWTFFEANEAIEFEWTDQITSEEYTQCIFLGQPIENRMVGAFWDVTVQWRGYKA